MSGRGPWWLEGAIRSMADRREQRGEAIGHPGALARSEDPARDYIQEAGRIVRGESRLIPELEHLRALVDAAGGALRTVLDDWDQSGTVRQIHGPISETTIDLVRALVARLDGTIAPPVLGAPLADIGALVERQHAARYPNGCPLMCEACTARLAPVRCRGCGVQHDGPGARDPWYCPDCRNEGY